MTTGDAEVESWEAFLGEQEGFVEFLERASSDEALGQLRRVLNNAAIRPADAGTVTIEVEVSKAFIELVPLILDEDDEDVDIEEWVAGAARHWLELKAKQNAIRLVATPPKKAYLRALLDAEDARVRWGQHADASDRLLDHAELEYEYPFDHYPTANEGADGDE